jgi:diguanylate cyclase
MQPDTLPMDVQRKVDHDRVCMLYAQTPGAMLVTVAVSVCLVLATTHGQLTTKHWLWLAVLLILVSMRGALYAVFLRAERLAGVRDPERWQRDSLRQWGWIYAVLVMLGGFHLALWPLLFFPEQSEAHRLTSVLFLWAMAGGAIAVLSVVRWLALAYGAILLLPASTMLLFFGGVDGSISGGLGYMYWLTMLFSVGRSNSRFVESLTLARRNAMLVEQMDRQSHALIESNAQLQTAQDEMRDTNLQLEARILDRTAALHRLATHDALTGLANRSRLTDVFFAHLCDDASPLSLLFIDLDGFKEINDAMGHAVGDSVLSEVAARLSDAAGQALAIARWGGDEFLILRHSHDRPEDEIDYAETLLEALRGPTRHQPYAIRVDACIGISHWPGDGETLQELIYSADLAVYAAKSEGRGIVRSFNDTLAEQNRRKSQVRRALALQLAEGCPDLRLVYQPIFEVRNGALASLEALLRWRHPDLGPISPAEFVPLAERSGDVITLGNWVMREACRFCAGFDAAQLPEICVNVSVQQLLHPGFIDDLLAALADSGLQSQRLTLELTESVFIADYEQIASVFRALEKLGIHIAIDDFGTGYSSLSYLQRLPAKILKIDGSFVRAFDTGGIPIVEASVSLARAFGMKVVAEGVETPAQLDVITALGADYVQGFLLGMPQSEEDTRSRLICGDFSMEPNRAPLRVAAGSVPS